MRKPDRFRKGDRVQVDHLTDHGWIRGTVSMVQYESDGKPLPRGLVWIKFDYEHKSGQREISWLCKHDQVSPERRWE